MCVSFKHTQTKINVGAITMAHFSHPRAVQKLALINCSPRHYFFKIWRWFIRLPVSRPARCSHDEWDDFAAAILFFFFAKKFKQKPFVRDFLQKKRGSQSAQIKSRSHRRFLKWRAANRSYISIIKSIALNQIQNHLFSDTAVHNRFYETKMRLKYILGQLSIGNYLDPN